MPLIKIYAFMTFYAPEECFSLDSSKPVDRFGAEFYTLVHVWTINCACASTVAPKRYKYQVEFTKSHNNSFINPARYRRSGDLGLGQDASYSDTKGASSRCQAWTTQVVTRCFTQSSASPNYQRCKGHFSLGATKVKVTLQNSAKREACTIDFSIKWEIMQLSK